MLAAAIVLLPAAAAAAQNACAAGKKACASTKVGGLLKCHMVAETKGESPNAKGCEDKVRAKFDGGDEPAKGCFAKLEAKYPPGGSAPCRTYGDVAPVEALVDGFVTDLVGRLDPAFPAVTLDRCAAGKKKCAATTLKARLKCHQLAETPGKAPDPNANGCLDKARTKFDGGTQPAKGCFAKLEAKYPPGSATACATTGDTAAIAAAIDAFVDRIVTAVDPAPTTTTTTAPTTSTVTVPPSTTTSTTLPQPEAVVITGRVLDVAGAGIAGALVQAGRTALEQAADGEGWFTVVASVGDAVGSDLLVAARAAGFADGLAKVPVAGPDGPRQVSIVLEPVAASVQVDTPQAGAAVETSDARVTIPAGVLPTTNPVQLDLTPLDPGGPGAQAFPGQDFLAAVAAGPANNGSGVVPLESVVLAEVRVTDLATGERISALDGAATIELRLPQAQQASYAVGDRIPWWYLDEASGLWVQDGEAEVFLGPDGAKWTRAVAHHFTWWNVDRAYESSSFTATFTRAGGGAGPVPGTADGATYSGSSPARYGPWCATPNCACFTVKQTTATQTEKVRLTVLVGGRSLWLRAAPGGGNPYTLTEDPAAAALFDTPSALASCYAGINLGQVVDFGTFVIDYNQPPLVTRFEPSRTTVCPASPTTALAVETSDPEGDLPLSIAFTAAVGTITPGADPTTASWTLPATPGTYDVSVVVTDSKGATSARTRSVTVGNCAPEIVTFTAPTSADPRITPTVHFEMTAVDADGGPSPLSYTWYIGGQQFAGSAIDWPVRGCGTQWVLGVASDGATNTERSTTITVLNACPAILSLSATPPTVPCAAASSAVAGVVTDADGDPLTYAWRTGSGSVTNVNAPATTWSSPPQPIQWTWVALEASDPYGGIGTSYVYLNVANVYPQVSVSASSLVVAPSGVVTLSASATDDGTIANIAWFAYSGGSLVPAGASATWTAPAVPGTYWIGAQATDNCGAASPGYVQIEVVTDPPPPPPPGSACSAFVQASPASGTAPLDTQLFAPVVGLNTSFTSYAWSFGDGIAFTTYSNRVVHRYVAPGNFTASVTVHDADGNCSATTPIVVGTPTTTTTTTTTSTTTTTTLPPPCQNPDGGPDELILTSGAGVGDADNGWTGATHNFSVSNSPIRLCLSGCDGSSDPDCRAVGTTGPGTPNGEFLGSAFPAVVGGTQLCVRSRWASSSVSGAFDLQTGEFDLEVDLLAESYLGACPPSGAPVAVVALNQPLSTRTSSLTGPRPCPGQAADDACGGGVCGATCTGSACVGTAPDPSNPGNTVCVDARGGISQACCSSNTTVPCFPTGGGGTLSRTGVAGVPVSAGGQAWPEPTYPKQASGVLAGVFCVAASGGPDAITGYPGPAATVSPGTVQVIVNP